MPEDGERFLEIEEAAEGLVATLEALYKEANSFKTATTQLDAVREKLVSLIGSTQDIAKDTAEVVKTLKAIGGPEILRSIDAVSKQLRSESIANEVRSKRLMTLVVSTLAVSLTSLVLVVTLLVR